MTQLFEIQVYGPALVPGRRLSRHRTITSDYPLRLQFSIRKKMHNVASALRCEGFRVTGEYDYTTRLNMDPKEAIESAKALLG